MEITPENFPAEKRDDAPSGEIAANGTQASPFTVVESEVASRVQIADRILARILADLSAMRNVVVRAASASMRDEERAFAQRDVERLKGDIARLTEMLAKFPIDEPGMTAAEYAESMALIARSIEEAESIIGNPHVIREADSEPLTDGNEALSKWFGNITQRGISEDEEK